MPTTDLVPFHAVGILPCRVGSSVTFPYNVALHHLMCKDKALFPMLEENLTALGLWEGGY